MLVISTSRRIAIEFAVVIIIIQEDIRSLEAFEMWIWRRMMKIPWTQHASNEQILGMVDESRSFMENLRKRQKNWIAHVLRHDSLLQKVIEWWFQGKKTPGRPRTMLLDALMREDEENVIDYAKLKEKAHDRKTWRQWERTCLWEKTPTTIITPSNSIALMLHCRRRTMYYRPVIRAICSV